ncbi:hypothetical protein BD309DRAFT_412246 [Dichomitus squalens]|nr:hypothetical protein BD309DRAFT_412246 [Dichomitus squalens]
MCATMVGSVSLASSAKAERRSARQPVAMRSPLDNNSVPLMSGRNATTHRMNRSHKVGSSLLMLAQFLLTMVSVFRIGVHHDIPLRLQCKDLALEKAIIVAGALQHPARAERGRLLFPISRYSPVAPPKAQVLTCSVNPAGGSRPVAKGDHK